MIVWLPKLMGESPAYLPENCHDVSRLLIEANLHYLERSMPEDPRYHYLTALVDEYYDLIGIRSATIKDSLSCLVVCDLSENEAEVKDFPDMLDTVFGGKGEGLCLSNTHASTYPVLSACVAGGQDGIGVICIDAHHDLSDFSVPLWKGNVFARLLADETISALLIAGVPVFRQEAILPALPLWMRKRICMLEDASDYRRLEQALIWLKETASAVYFSIDPDGLMTRTEKLTALEYCPFHTIANLARNDFSELDQRQFDSALEDIIRPINKDLGGRRNLYHIGETGLTIQQMVDFLHFCRQFIKNSGMKYGVNISGSRIVGDIVELYGPDIGSSTSDMVGIAASALLFQS